MAATLVGGVLFVAGGWIELGDARTILGMNDLTAIAHLVSGRWRLVGGLAAALRAGRPYGWGLQPGDRLAIMAMTGDSGG